METFYVNSSGLFWDVYSGMSPSGVRRKIILDIFIKHPGAILPVNNKHQASTKDPDLTRLIKKGVLKQVRMGGGGKTHWMNKWQGKRQTVLMLVD